MLRPLAILAGLVLIALLALFLLRSREATPALADAPSAGTPTLHAAPSAPLDSANSPASAREAQVNPETSPSASQKTADVHGHLLFEGTRVPVAGAHIVFLYFDPALLTSALAELSPNARLAQTRSLIVDTDSEGSYSAPFADGVLLSEAQVLEREATGHAMMFSEAYVDAFVPTKKSLELRVLHGALELDLFVGVGSSLHGLVLEREGRKPVAGAEVTFLNGEGKAFRCASGSDGQFTLRGITFNQALHWSGRMTMLVVDHPDFVRSEHTLEAPDDQGRWPDQTVRLDRGLSVGGIVVDATGAPVRGLALGLRPLHGSLQEGLCEFEGEWKTTSDEAGIFHFPMVPAFERAWLETERKEVEGWTWHGASRTLLRGKDPYLTSVELRLHREVGVEIRALYPDGSAARSEDLLLLREDEDGKLRSAWQKPRVVCPAGRATRVVAWCSGREKDEEGVAYRGEVVVTVGGLESDPHAEIQLVPAKMEHKKPEPGQRSLGSGAGKWINSTIVLQFVDRASGQPLPDTTLIGIEWRSGSSFSQIGKDAKLRLDCEPGWETMKLTVEGFEAHTIEFEVKDNEPQTLTLALDRLH